MAKKRKKPVSKLRRIIEGIILIVAICVFIYAAFNLYTIWKANSDEANEIEEIRELVNVPKTEKELDEFEIKFEELLAVNPEVVGWIVVLDTDISYPVVKGNDNDYYLDHTFKRESNYAGAIFMDYRNNADLSDLNTFIYGHNVYHGTMFAELENYMDKEFFEKHPYVYYYTPDANYKLQVFSSYVSKSDSSSYRIDFQDDEDYQTYINEVREKGRYDSGVEMSAVDHMITLYTCAYENGNNPFNTDPSDIDERYYIHCKIIRALSGEMPYQRTDGNE